MFNKHSCGEVTVMCECAVCVCSGGMKAVVVTGPTMHTSGFASPPWWSNDFTCQSSVF